MRKVFIGILALIFAYALGLGILVYFTKLEKKNAITEAEMKYVSDPVMLYQTVGIKYCGYDNREKGKYSGAVFLEGNDLIEAKNYFEKKSRGQYTVSEIQAVLYINAPEATENRIGQPALLPLRRKDGVYCALGLAGSYSMEPFIEFKKKYQKQIER